MTAAELPAPLVPADVDLRDFAFMPLEVDRLRDSDLAATPDGEVFRAAVISWCVAWHQTPAASLPDDDAVLARLLGYGRDLKGWQRLREAGALRGWVRCSDDRLYHEVVAEKALESWLEKLAQRISGGEGNMKRWGVAFDRAAVEAQMEVARTMLAALNPDSRALRKRRTAKRSSASGGSPDGNPDANPGANPVGTEKDPDTIPTGVPMRPKNVAIDRDRKETGTGTETSLLKPLDISPRASPSTPSAYGAVAILLGQDVKVTSMNPFLVAWVDELKAGEPQLRETLDRCRQEIAAPEKIPAKYFDTTLRNLLREQTAPRTPGNGSGRRHHTAQPEQDFTKLDYSKGFDA